MQNPHKQSRNDVDYGEYTDVIPAPLPQAELDDEQRLACLRLIRSNNVGPVTFRELINHYGGAREALAALPEIYSRTGGKRKFGICPKARAEAELEAARRCGAKPVFTIEPGYPVALAQIVAPPPMLYVIGNPDFLVSPAIGIVGSRGASAAGLKLTRQFAIALGKAGFVVASGLARGVDGAAHKASLKTGTIGVVAGGPNVIYPPEHEKLHNQICEDGCIVSEMPPGFKPRAKDFPRRNRIIAGLSLGVLVVEAARRSGTLITARLAGEFGREVFAVPGHPLDPRAEGTNHLLKTGATLATCARDIIETIHPMLGPGCAPADRTHLLETSSAMEAPPMMLSVPIALNQLGRVEALLGPAPINIDEVARAADLPVRVIQTAIMELDLAGRIERHGQQLVSLRPLVED